MTGTDIKRKPPAEITDTAALIVAITKASRDPEVNIDKMRFLLDTRRSLLDEEAEEQWRDAMAQVQAEMRQINKDLANPQTHSRYSSLAALDSAIRPIYSAHGFAVTFDTEKSDEPNTIMVVAYAERTRHKRRFQIPMPADGKGARGGEVMSKTHATGSAVSYGRRYLLCMIFNLVTADDDGNRASGYRRERTAYPDSYEEVPPGTIERAAHTRKAMGEGSPKASLTGASLEAALAPITKKELAELRKLMTDAGVALTGEETILQHFEVESLEDLTHVQFEVACNNLKARAKEIRDAD